jgi:hypothetical protein
LFSNDAGSTWDWVCERAIGYSGNEDPTIAISGSGAVVVGTFAAMMRSIDGGCHWSGDASWPANVVDLASRPSAPDRLYAVTSRFANESDAGVSYKSQLFVSEDAGAHWSVRSTLDVSLLVDSVEVAPSDRGTLYISAVRARVHDAHDVSAVLLVSVDDGAHFKERPVPTLASDRGMYIGAVDPNDASLIYLRSSGPDASHLVVSKDSGTTFHEVVRGGPLQGFAITSDGATIFTGGPSDGLLRAAKADDHFEKISATPVQCLTAVGATLFACAPTGAGYVLGASSDRGATFSPKLTLAGMRGPLKCASPSAMEQCGEDWSALQSLLAPGVIADASPVISAGDKADPPKKSVLGCAMAHSRSDGTGFFLAAFLIAILASRLARRPSRSGSWGPYRSS